jgi:hypothetical protein
MATLPIKTPIKVPFQLPDGTTGYRDDFNYSFADPTDPTGQRPHPEFLGHIVKTGPIAGTVALRSGNVYDVTEPYIHVLPEEGGEVACVLHRMHNANNTEGFGPHAHTVKCGREAGLESFVPTADDKGDRLIEAVTESSLPTDTTTPQAQ